MTPKHSKENRNPEQTNLKGKPRISPIEPNRPGIMLKMKVKQKASEENLKNKGLREYRRTGSD